MIAKITGQLSHKSPEYIIVEVQGIGYQIFVPLSTYYKLPELSNSVTIFVYTHVRENLLNLYGFYTPEEKSMFESLLNISGIGPKAALNILSGISVAELRHSVIQKDIRRLTAIPGLGKKSAERVIIELKDKFGNESLILNHESRLKGQEAEEQNILHDAVSALVNLGYKKIKAEEIIPRIKHRVEPLNVENLVKEGLRVLAKTK